MTANEPKTKREELHELLSAIPGVKAAYYIQPPSRDMKFPCIVYNVERIYSDLANNKTYDRKIKYTLTYISSNDDDTVYDILDLPYTSFENKFVNDNLFHTKIGMYY